MSARGVALAWPTHFIHLAAVVQTLDSAIHRIKIYPMDSTIGFPNTYPMDSDLSGGWRYPTFEQPGPAQLFPLGKFRLTVLFYTVNFRVYALDL